tara:strand:+ start:421 stop:624 length:204 start_codon:yes stop_codon:yes gene_type:complete
MELNKRTMSVADYKKLCRRIHKRYKVSLNLPFWEACELADEIDRQYTTEQRTYELLDEAAIEESMEA